MDASQTWVVVTDGTANGLVETARTLGTEIVAVVAGPRSVAESVAVGVDRVLWLGEPDGVPVEAFGYTVADLVGAAAPLAVVGSTSPTGRALLGWVAARLQAPVLTDVAAVQLSDGEVVVTRSVLGGLSEHRTAVRGGTTVLAVEPGSDPVAGTASTAVEDVAVNPLGTAHVVSMTAKEHTGADLGAARTVVSVGRGLKAQEDVALITALADALGGEVACSRPLAEGVDWIAKERYVGISGQRIAPDLYVAVGISGQLQHMVGVRQAKVVVAVNSDKAAPIFSQCDYGVVGDLYDVVPALTAALRVHS